MAERAIQLVSAPARPVPVRRERAHPTLARNPPPITLGALDSPHEKEAEQIARKVMDPLAQTGIGQRVSTLSESPAAGHGRNLEMPPAVQRVLQATGQPLDHRTRGFMERRLQQDLGWVRIHDGTQAAAASSVLDARAYTLGPNVVFGSGQYAPETALGRHVLAHELTHAIQQRGTASGGGVIQRVGLFESIARFFGGGTFSSGELTIYLDALAATGRIQNRNDSDNKARAVVQRGLYASQPLAIRVLLVREMLSGYTSGDDEQGILTILRNASAGDLERIVEQIGSDHLIDKFSGDNLDRLYVVLARSARGRTQPVATDWFLAYRTLGVVDRTDRAQGVMVDALQIRPDGSPDVHDVVSKGVANAGPTGAPVPLASQVKHPRGAGGTGFMAIHTLGATAPVWARPSATYAPITRDQHRVTAIATVTYAPVDTGTASTSVGTQSGRSTTDTASTGNKHTTTSSDSGHADTSRTLQHGSTATQATQQGHEQSTDSSVTNTTTTSVSLTGTVSAEAKAALHLTTGMSVSGELLGALLAMAGPEGAAIGWALTKAGALKAITLTLGLGGDGSFTLAGQLSGTAARSWTEAKTHSVHRGSSSSQRQERGQQASESVTQTAGRTHDQSVQDANESGRSTTHATDEQQTTSHTNTTNQRETAATTIDLGFDVK